MLRSLLTLALFALTTLLASTSSAVADNHEVKWNELSPKQQRGYVTAVKTFTNHPWLVKMAFCESSFEHTNADGSVKVGEVDPDDTGFMQINRRYHERDARKMDYDLANMSDNMAYAIHLAQTQGKQPWSASFRCVDNLKLIGFPSRDSILS